LHTRYRSYSPYKGSVCYDSYTKGKRFFFFPSFLQTPAQRNSKIQNHNSENPSIWDAILHHLGEMLRSNRTMLRSNRTMLRSNREKLRSNRTLLRSNREKLRSNSSLLRSNDELLRSFSSEFYTYFIY
jgi:hypothetical protein